MAAGGGSSAGQLGGSVNGGSNGGASAAATPLHGSSVNGDGGYDSDGYNFAPP